MNATQNTVFAIHSCAVKIDMSKSIKLTSATKGGFDLATIAKFSSLASYLRGAK